MDGFADAYKSLIIQDCTLNDLRPSEFAHLSSSAYLINPSFASQTCHLIPDAIKIHAPSPGVSKLTCTPIKTSPNVVVSKSDRLELCMVAILLQNNVPHLQCSHGTILPERLRDRLPEDAVMEFPVETAQSIYDFRPNDVIGRIAPRPLLLLHAARDSVTPTDASIAMFQRAGQPTELILLSDIDHFPRATGNSRLYGILKSWFDLYFPLRV